MIDWQLVTEILVAIIVVCYLTLFVIWRKSRIQHKEKFPEEADQVEEERDL